VQVTCSDSVLIMWCLQEEHVEKIVPML